MPDTNTNYIFGTGSIPINIKTAQLATFADGTTKQQGYQVAEVNKLISTMLTGWDANGNKPKSMSDNYLELILSCDNGFVVKKRLQFPHIIAWQNDNTPYNIADVYKEFSIDNWLKADDFENPDITLVVEPTDEILTTSTATPPEATTEQSGRFYLYYRNLPVGVNRVHIEFHIKAKTEPIDFDLEVIDGLSWKDAQVILASNEQAKINVLLGGVKDVYNFTGAEGNFENITMHEWSALYQQIINLKPNNRFTHDLYFYVYDEATDVKLNDLIKINTFNIPLSIEYNNKAVDNNGEVKDVANFGMYTPIFIPKGVTLEVTTIGYLLGALCLVKEGKYTPVISYGNDKIVTPRTSKYTTEEAGLYVISSVISNDVSLVSNSKIESNDTHILPIALIGEAEWRTTGKVYEPCDETNNAQLTYMATQNYIEFNNEEDILNSISNISGKTLYIYQYDEMFNFLGDTHFVVDDNTLTISSYINKVGCRYIKILISNSDMSYFSHKNYYVEVKITSKNRPKLVYNGYGENNEILFRTYDIEKPYITDNCSVADGSATTDYRGNNERLLNWGYIVLPENYSIDGEPVPVIIHCHGTSGVIFNQKSLPYNTAYLKFLAKCGYAVIGCSTFSNEYRNENDDGDFPTPLAMSCYENLWKYMTTGYNLDKSKAYIFGYSAGGMDTILVSQSKVLPIRAAASLAGVVDLICYMRILADYCNEFFYKQIGMGVVDLPTGLAEDGIRMHPMKESVTQQILDNWDKFVGYNPFCFNSDLDYKAFLAEYSKLTNYTESLKNNQIINELVSKAKVYYKTPIKFWYAVDDRNVPIQLARWWQTMVRNAGGLCYMREFPANCGAHYAVGYTGDDSLTPKVDYVTPFGEIINTPVAYAEMVDWFKRW